MKLICSVRSRYALEHRSTLVLTSLQLQCQAANCSDGKDASTSKLGIRFVGVDVPEHVLCQKCFANGKQTTLRGGKAYHRFITAQSDPTSDYAHPWSTAVRERIAAALWTPEPLLAPEMQLAQVPKRKEKATKDEWDFDSDDDEEAAIDTLSALPHEPILNGLHVEWGFKGRHKSSLHLALTVSNRFKLMFDCSHAALICCRESINP